MILHTERDTPVKFWTGLRAGEPRIGKLSHDGVYDIGGTPCVYVAGVGAVALTHVEEIFEDGAVFDSKTA